MKRGMTGALFLLLAVALVAAGDRWPAGVERLYSQAAYPALSATLACPASLVPFSVAEAALGIGVLLLAARLVQAVRDVRRRGLRPGLGSLLSFLLLAAGVMGLAFVVLWGLNYRRLTLAATLGLDARPAQVKELEALARTLVQEANEQREGLREDDRGTFAATGGPKGVLARTRLGFTALAEQTPWLRNPACVRPKPLLLSRALSWLGLTGIYSPFTGEPNVNVDAPEVELPFSASHEAAHAMGIAREDEASYIGYRACRSHPDRDFNYAGTLAASIHASNALHGADAEAWRALEKDRSPAVARDLQALREWAARYEGPASRAGARVNDAYLRAQGQKDGVRSYGRMVDLLIAERRMQSSANETTE